MEKITFSLIESKNNEIIKDTKKLLLSSKYRRSQRKFVLEGARLCFDVLNSDYGIELLLLTESVYEKYTHKVDALRKISAKVCFISSDVSQKLSQTESSQGIFAVCPMKNAQSTLKGSKIIVLDRVQDPSNVGALVRTAEALGIDSIVMYNCCDIYNPKTLRSSMGSMLRMNIIRTDNLKTFLVGCCKQYKIYSCVPDSAARKITDTDFSGNCICVIGNEANGVDEDIKKCSNSLITIPMLGRAESLNAYAAASIVMWEMLK